MVLLILEMQMGVTDIVYYITW